MFDFFKPAPHIEEIQDPAVVKKNYLYWRIRIFYSMYVGYAFYYLTRKSFTFAMPFMMTSLGYTKAQLGILGSILYITYGLSKFFSGIISDRSNPRYFMSIGLIITGLVNISFGLSSSLIFFAIFWGMNGIFQGWGWPPCARLLTHWYSQSERGRWWGVWNTSHNIGGALIPLLCSFVAKAYGWRSAMMVPGFLCIGAGLYLLNRLRDTPESLGLPAIEKYREDYPSKKIEEEQSELSSREILFEYVLKNRYIWALGIAYFFVYVIRTAVNDWGQLYLYEYKHFSLQAAATCIVWFEVGGFFGSLAAGWSSDYLFGGKRGPVNVLFSFLVVLMLIFMWLMPANTYLFAAIGMFSVGFLIFGPQMLIGIAAAELAHKKAAGTATGFAGYFAYLGAAAAGYPFGKIAQEWGWPAFLGMLAACGLITVMILLPMWSIKARSAAPEKV
ncbi:MAG: MFS transporter [Chlamydiae bacterium]|nr:MFS transporter [Chlamydiota bacterium]